MIYFT